MRHARDPYEAVGRAARAAIERLLSRDHTLAEADTLLAILAKTATWSLLREQIAPEELVRLTQLHRATVFRALASLERDVIVRERGGRHRRPTLGLPTPPGSHSSATQEPSLESRSSATPESRSSATPRSHSSATPYENYSENYSENARAVGGDFEEAIAPLGGVDARQHRALLDGWREEDGPPGVRLCVDDTLRGVREGRVDRAAPYCVRLVQARAWREASPNGRTPLERAETYVRNAGHHLPEPALREDLAARSLEPESLERLVELARDLGRNHEKEGTR